jgi:hypothetical protein
VRRRSASFRASMRSFLFPNFSSVFLRGSLDQHLCDVRLEQIFEPSGTSSFFKFRSKLPRRLRMTGESFRLSFRE